MKSFRKISLEWLKVPKLFLANSIFKKEHNDIFPRGRLFHIHQPQKLVRVHILLWFGLRFAPADHRCVNFTTGLDGSTLIRKAWPCKLIIFCTIHTERLLVICSMAVLRAQACFCTLPYTKLVCQINFLCLVKLDHAKSCAAIAVHGQRKQQQENDPRLHRGILFGTVPETVPRVIRPKHCSANLTFYNFTSSHN